MPEVMMGADNRIRRTGVPPEADGGGLQVSSLDMIRHSSGLEVCNTTRFLHFPRFLPGFTHDEASLTQQKGRGAKYLERFAASRVIIDL
jgi:hypothetical protein